MRHRIAACVIALILVFGIVAPPVTASSAHVGTSELSGACEPPNPERAVSFAGVLHAIRVTNEGSGDAVSTPGFLADFEVALRMIAAFNQDEPLAVTDGMRTSWFKIHLSNSRDTAATAVVQLRCTSRSGSPVVYNDTVTVGGNSTMTLMIGTEGNASAYDLRVRTAGGAFTDDSTVRGVYPYVRRHPVLPGDGTEPTTSFACVAIGDITNVSYNDNVQHVPDEVCPGGDE